MKRNARLADILIAVTLLVSLVACSATPTPTAAPQPTQAPATDVPATTAPEPTEAQPTEAQPTEAEPEPTEAEPEATEEPSGEAVTIRYANWNLGTEEENNIQRQLVAAYIEANPNVTVEFVDMSGEGGWDAILTAYAARGELPDVFMANNVPLYVTNGWLADLSEFVADDADWANVPQVWKDAVTYGDGIYGLPAAQFFMGYFVNRDLYEAANLDAPEYGLSVEEFEEAVTELHDVENGVLGLDEQEFMMGWYANSQDPNLKWFSYDGSQMNYNSEAFKAAVEEVQEMGQYTWQGLSEEQKTNFNSVGPWELFTNQEVGMRWDASWNVPGWLTTAEFDWDFIGFPGGNQALVGDVIVVSETAADKAAAYEFAKWMTFSTEAYAVEADLAREAGSAPKLPVSLDDASLALYAEFVDKPGINAALENLDNSTIESLAKIVPGYINARWEGKPGIDIGENLDVNLGFIFGNVNSGLFNYADYSAQLEEFANQQLADAAAAME
jgi:ABC-type glycerol-3-phosphate transport system substrate-binding protein